MEKKVLIVSTSLRKNSNSERLAGEFASDYDVLSAENGLLAMEVIHKKV